MFDVPNWLLFFGIKHSEQKTNTERCCKTGTAHHFGIGAIGSSDDLVDGHSAI